jgi:hypothetical protein
MNEQEKKELMTKVLAGDKLDSSELEIATSEMKKMKPVDAIAFALEASLNKLDNIIEEMERNESCPDK